MHNKKKLKYINFKVNKVLPFRAYKYGPKLLINIKIQ